MHHSQIGQIIEIFQDMYLLSDQKPPITIESYWSENPWNEGQRDHMGLCITVPLNNGRIDLGINAWEEDSRFTAIYYYKDKLDSSPTESFMCQDRDFCLNSLRCFIKNVALVDKGSKDSSFWMDSEELHQHYGITRCTEGCKNDDEIPSN